LVVVTKYGHILLSAAQPASTPFSASPCLWMGKRACSPAYAVCTNPASPSPPDQEETRGINTNFYCCRRTRRLNTTHPMAEDVMVLFSEASQDKEAWISKALSGQAARSPDPDSGNLSGKSDSQRAYCNEMYVPVPSLGFRRCFAMQALFPLLYSRRYFDRKKTVMKSICIPTLSKPREPS
jgi:hypothetical protein